MTARALMLRRSNSFGLQALLVEARRAAIPVQNESYSQSANIARIGRLSRLSVAIGLAISASSLAAQTLPEAAI